MKTSIFISYRRADSLGSAGRIYDRLLEHFEEENIFMDVEIIEPGADFVKEIENAVRSCDIALIIIGPDWLSITDDKGNRRLDLPEDFVRLEVATALKMDIIVIPVLVENAEMPKSLDLPEDLKLLARKNAVEIRHTRFHSDISKLIDALIKRETEINIEAKRIAEEKLREKIREEEREKEERLIARKAKQEEFIKNLTSRLIPVLIFLAILLGTTYLGFLLLKVINNIDFPTAIPATATSTKTPYATIIPSKTPYVTITSTMLPISTSTISSNNNISTMTVDAKELWVSTGIQIKAGDFIQIKYISGEWTSGGEHTLHDANGSSSGYICSNVIPYSDCAEPVPDAIKGALIGKIGENPPFLVGNILNFTAQSTGTLFVSINDSVYADNLLDNSGEILIQISID